MPRSIIQLPSTRRAARDAGCPAGERRGGRDAAVASRRRRRRRCIVRRRGARCRTLLRFRLRRPHTQRCSEVRGDDSAAHRYRPVGCARAATPPQMPLPQCNTHSPFKPERAAAAALRARAPPGAEPKHGASRAQARPREPRPWPTALRGLSRTVSAAVAFASKRPVLRDESPPARVLRNPAAQPEPVFFDNPVRHHLPR